MYTREPGLTSGSALPVPISSRPKASNTSTQICPCPSPKPCHAHPLSSGLRLQKQGIQGTRGGGGHDLKRGTSLGPLLTPQGQREELHPEPRGQSPLLHTALAQWLMYQAHSTAGHPAPESDPSVFLSALGLQRGKDLSRQGADPAPQPGLSSRKLERRRSQ